MSKKITRRGALGAFVLTPTAHAPVRRIDRTRIIERRLVGKLKFGKSE
jgi:hypothetical protein